MKNEEKRTNFRGGVKVSSQECEKCREEIIEMTKEIENDLFLKRICIVLKKHIRKRGG